MSSEEEVDAQEKLARLLDRLEFDFVKYGEVDRLARALRKRIERQMKQPIASMELFRCNELEWAAISRATDAAAQPLTTEDLQRVIKLKSKTMRVDCVFTVPGIEGEQTVTVRVVKVAKPFMCFESGRTFESLAELREHKKALSVLKAGPASSLLGAVTPSPAGAAAFAGLRKKAIAASAEEQGASDEVGLVRCYRVTLATVAFQLRPLPKSTPVQIADNFRSLSNVRLQAACTFAFWRAYLMRHKKGGTIGEVVTLLEDEMESVSPSRMDIPFCVDLTQKELFDSAAIASLFHKAADGVREHATFPSWHTSKRPDGNYFEILDSHVLPLEKIDGPDSGPKRDAHARRRATRISDLSADQVASFAGGDPFVVRLRTRGSTDTSTTELFVTPIATKDGEEKRFRLCKIDLGYSDLRSDSVWAVESFIQILLSILPDGADSGVALARGTSLPSLPDTPIGSAFTEALAGLSLLQRRCLVMSMRRVGLHVWDTSRIASASVQEFLLVAAPPHVLAARAEHLKMRVRVNPNYAHEGLLQGGFTPDMFLRGGPLQEFFTGTPQKPYLYKDFFVPFSPVQKQELVLDLIRRPRAVVDGSSATLRLRKGGANINPDELVAESVLLDFFPLHDEAYIDRLNEEWVKLPAAFSDYGILGEETVAGMIDRLKSKTSCRLRIHALAVVASTRMIDTADGPAAPGTTGPAAPGAPAAGAAEATVAALATADSKQKTIKRNQVAPSDGGAATTGSQKLEPLAGRPLPKPMDSGAATETKESLPASGRAPKGTAPGVGGVSGGGATGAFADAPASYGDPLEPETLRNKSYRRPDPPSIWSRMCRCLCCWYYASACSGLRKFFTAFYAVTLGQLNQPLNQVFDYYGGTVAFYFLYIQHYTEWLTPVAFLGLVVQIVLWVHTEGSTLNGTGNAVDAVTIDDFLTWSFAVLMMVWATMCLEYFKRNSAKRAYQWDVVGAEGRAESIRPQYIIAMQTTQEETAFQSKILAKVFDLQTIALKSRRDAWGKQLRKDLENYNELYYYPDASRALRYVRSFIVCAVMVSLCLIIMVGVLILPGRLFAEDTTIFGVEAAALISGVSNGLVIPTLNYLYGKVATKLTDSEYHRYQSSYDDSLIIKLFSFQFVNSYSTLFVIAFWFQDVALLGSQLGGIMITGQVIGIINQHFRSRALRLAKIVLSKVANAATKDKLDAHDQQIRTLAVAGAAGKLKAKAKRSKATRLGDVEFKGTDDDGAAEATAAPEDVHVAHNRVRWTTMRQAVAEVDRPATTNLTREYLEQIIQFGYVAMFCAAFPLAPLTAFIKNVIEIRLDGLKVLIARRPFSLPASGIGQWYTILQLLSVLAVFTNTLIIYMQSLRADGSSKIDGLAPSLTSVGAVWVTIGLEHILVVVKMLLRALTADVPNSVKQDIFREQYYLLKEADHYAGEVQTNDEKLVCEDEGVHDDSDGESDIEDEDDSDQS